MSWNFNLFYHFQKLSLAILNTKSLNTIQYAEDIIARLFKVIFLYRCIHDWYSIFISKNYQSLAVSKPPTFLKSDNFEQLYGDSCEKTGFCSRPTKSKPAVVSRNHERCSWTLLFATSPDIWNLNKYNNFGIFEN